MTLIEQIYIDLIFFTIFFLLKNAANANNKTNISKLILIIYKIKIKLICEDLFNLRHQCAIKTPQLGEQHPHHLLNFSNWAQLDFILILFNPFCVIFGEKNPIKS